MTIFKSLMIDMMVCAMLGGGVFVTFANAAPPVNPPASAPATKPAPAPAAAKAAPLPVGTKTHCAVSGEEFTVKADTKQVTHNGKNYAFCCADCQPTFEKNPAKYAK